MKLIYFLVLIKILESIKETDFCYKTKIDNKLIYCHDKHSFICVHDICSIDINACQRLVIFSTMTLTREGFYKDKYKKFKSRILNCTEPTKYKWNPKDVCLNTKNCAKPSYYRRSSLISYKCKCTGKYSFNCNNDYCASNKRACQGLKNKQLSKVTKCKALKRNHLK